MLIPGHRLLFTLFVAFLSISSAQILRNRRQTMLYPEELKAFAHPHPGTKILVGYAARYAPQEWPKWYSRTMMKWGGESRMAPYEGYYRDQFRQRLF